MARVRGEEEEVSIFNMSFLDVFCCTVGALIFIYVVQILRTKDMVERRTLEEIQARLAAAQADLTKTESAREAARQELAGLTKQVADAEARLEEARKALSSSEAKVKEQGKTIEDLMAQLRNPKRAAPSGLAGLTGKDSGQGRGASRAMETQKGTRGQYLLGNLETLTIVCAGEGLYLGMSREPIPASTTGGSRALFREFLRFHNPKAEGLWRTVWGEGARSLQASVELQRLEEGAIGAGLKVARDPNLQRALVAFASGKGKTVDLEEEGRPGCRAQYEDADGDGIPELKRVNVDDDPFFEEVHLDLDRGKGQWGRLLVDADGDNKYDLLLQDLVPTDGDYERKYGLPNLQTGKAVFLYEDTDNDGVWDLKTENTNLTNEVWEKTFVQFDPVRLRWAGLLVDANEDGKPDVLWRDTDMSNDDWEEKLVDEDGDGDGVWDIRWKDLDPRDNDWEVRLTQRVGNTDVWKRCEVDSDGDGAFDTMLVDANGDGEWDEEYMRSENGADWVKKGGDGK